MAKRAVRRTVETIDPMFNIPDGVDELVYDEDLTDDVNSIEGAQEADQIIFEEDVAVDGIPTPQILEIISQTMTTNAAGDERVDVVLKVTTIEGVDKYEFRVSRV